MAIEVKQISQDDDPMKLAVLADIHGNAPALRAVMADMRRFDVSEVINLGDHFSGPIEPAATADLLLNADFHSVCGNHDRWLIEQDISEMGPTDRFAFDALKPGHLAWLRTLDATKTLSSDIFLCHGTPTSDETYWLERVDGNGLVRFADKNEIEAKAKGIQANLMLCAHSHVPRCVRLTDGRVLLNPGSVGCPAYEDHEPVYHRVQTGTPNASYAIVEGTGKHREITFRSIPYDTQEAVVLARSNGREDWARALATGWVDALAD